MDCVKIEQAAGCVTRANGETENILIVREFGESADGRAVLVRTHLTDINGDHIELADGDFARIGACLACCGDVVLSDVNPPGNNIATITLANGQQVDLNETVTEFTGLYDETTGIKIGEYTAEDGVVTEVFTAKQSIDVNLTPISYVPTPTGNTQNLGEVVVAPNGTIFIIDMEGDAQALTMPTFKELRRFYVDPNGSDITGNGAAENPYLTPQAAVDQMPSGSGFITILNEGVTGDFTLSNANTAVAGASSAYASSSRPNNVTVSTPSGTSNRLADLTILGTLQRTGNAPLYLNNVTVNGQTTIDGAAYVEIKDSTLQDSGIVQTGASTILIRDSLIGASTFDTPGATIILRDVAINAGECVTIGAGVVYSLSGVQGCVNIDPAAIPVEDALLLASLPADAALAAETTSFNNLRITNPPLEASPTKVLTYNETTGQVEYSDFPVTTPETTSLLPVVYNGGWVGAQADEVGNLAKALELSDGTITASGLVTWTGHGLTVGETYYTSQTTAGAYVTPEPTNGLSQKLFTVIDADTIDIQVQEGLELVDDIGTGATSFAQTVFVNSNDPATATEFFLDPENPTNDPSLAQNSANIYIGQDGSTWTWDGTAYQTYEFPTTVPHGFRARLNNNAVTVPNATSVITSNYQTAENTTGGAWNPATGVFTAARAGWYQANASVLYAPANWAAGRYSQINIQKNNVGIAANLAMREVAVNNSFASSATSSVAVYLNVGDTLRVQLFQNSGSNKVTHSPLFNTFSVTQIQ